MENQTHFDLTRALAAWRHELSTQSGIAAEDLRELEAHLIDCLGAGLHRGMSERDAFENAVRQLGASDRIGREFEKLNPLTNWRHRVFLMAFAGLSAWVWCQVMQTLALGIQVFWRFTTPWGLAFTGLLNVLLPAILLAFLATGRIHGLVRAFSWLFQERWRILAATVLYALVVNYATAWAMWHQPNHENIFGPGVREQISVGVLFWEYVSGFPAWPGPLVALLLWLAPGGNRIVPGRCEYGISMPDFNREMVFWLAVGGLALGCFSALSGGFSLLWSRLTYLLFPTSEGAFRVASAAGSWLLVGLLCVLAVLAARGGLGRLANVMARRLGSRPRIAATGAALILVSYGFLGLWNVDAPVGHRMLMFLYLTAWPAVLVGFIAWLAPAARRHNLTPV